jgi:hypothetical protein
MNGKKGKRSKKMRAEPCEQMMTYNIDLVSVKCSRNRLISVFQWSENYPNTLIPKFQESKIYNYQMRHMFIVIDGSACMIEKDLKPSRFICSLKVRPQTCSPISFIYVILIAVFGTNLANRKVRV